MKTKLVFAGVVVVLVGALFPDARSAAPDPPKVCKNPILGIIEGPDPVTGRCPWDTATVQDGPGASNPSWTRHGATQRVVVAWAEPVGRDHDVALREWTAGGPGRTEYLSATLDDDLDPRVEFDAEGTLHLVWWRRAERDEVLYVTREASGRWSADLRITAGRRPSLAVVDGRAWIAFERDAGDRAEIVVAPADGEAGSPERIVRPTTGGVAYELRVDAGRLWLAWWRADVPGPREQQEIAAR